MAKTFLEFVQNEVNEINPPRRNIFRNILDLEANVKLKRKTVRRSHIKKIRCGQFVVKS